MLLTKDAADIVDHLFDMIRQSLEQGTDVKLPGFGNFMVRQKRQCVDRTPKTGEAIPVMARKVISFKPSQVLRDRVKGS
jgi:integration host factor subunit alpha